MLDLTNQEKTILLFLTLSLIIGIGVNVHKKSNQGLELNVGPHKIDALQDADRFIEQYRLININSSNIDELTRLPGIGEKLAQRIVDYHRRHGPFMNREELMQVKGIGEKKFERMKDLIILQAERATD